MFSLVYVVCCILSGINNASICHSEQFYGFCETVCDVETSAVRHPRHSIGSCATERNTYQTDTIFIFRDCSIHFNQKIFLFLIFKCFNYLFVSSSLYFYVFLIYHLFTFF